MAKLLIEDLKSWRKKRKTKFKGELKEACAILYKVDLVMTIDINQEWIQGYTKMIEEAERIPEDKRDFIQKGIVKTCSVRITEMQEELPNLEKRIEMMKQGNPSYKDKIKIESLSDSLYFSVKDMPKKHLLKGTIIERAVDMYSLMDPRAKFYLNLHQGKSCFGVRFSPNTPTVSKEKRRKVASLVNDGLARAGFYVPEVICS